MVGIENVILDVFSRASGFIVAGTGGPCAAAPRSGVPLLDRRVRPPDPPRRPWSRGALVISWGFEFDGRVKQEIRRPGLMTADDLESHARSMDSPGKSRGVAGMPPRRGVALARRRVC